MAVPADAGKPIVTRSSAAPTSPESSRNAPMLGRSARIRATTASQSRFTGSCCADGDGVASRMGCGRSGGCGCSVRGAEAGPGSLALDGGAAFGAALGGTGATLVSGPAGAACACPTPHARTAAISTTNHGYWLARMRSEEHTSELQSPCNLVCRLLLEKKKKKHCYMTVEHDATQ